GAHARVAVFLEVLQKNFANFVTSHFDSSLAIWIEECTHLLGNEFELKTLSQQMIEKFLRFHSCLWPSTQPSAFFDGRVDELLFGRFRVNEFECFVGDAV